MVHDEHFSYVSEVAESQPESAISVRGLSKSFGAQAILADINFNIAENEMLVVLGPSGSGKTTLLRIIAGLEQPDSGEIYLHGRLSNKLSPQARRLGVVFQEQALFQHMSVEQNIAYGLRLRRVKNNQIEKIVDEMLELTGLGKHRKKIPSQLSGGQRQRVAVARALAYKPEALLFDEPFSALDAVTRTELRREVRAMLHAANVSALFITHDQEEALELGDRIAVLNNGRIEQIDKPFEIYNHPQNEFVATFLGVANVLLGRWRQGRVAIGPVRLKAPDNSPDFLERQPVKIIFRPEDVSLNFQPQLLDAPYYLCDGVVENISYTGPIERLIVRLNFETRSDSVHVKTQPGKSSLTLVGESYVEGFPITVTRSKWEANEMCLSSGDQVAVGLKDYRLLAHYPISSETGAKALRG